VIIYATFRVHLVGVAFEAFLGFQLCCCFANWAETGSIANRQIDNDFVLGNWDGMQNNNFSRKKILNLLPETRKCLPVDKLFHSTESVFSQLNSNYSQNVKKICSIRKRILLLFMFLKQIKYTKSFFCKYFRYTILVFITLLAMKTLWFVRLQ